MEQTYYKARNTLIEMMTDRKYILEGTQENNFEIFNRSFEEFKTLFESNQMDLMDLAGIRTPTGLPVYVRVHYNKTDLKEKQFFDKGAGLLGEIAQKFKINLSEKNLREFLQQVHVIIVYRAAKKDDKYDTQIENLYANEPNVELFPVHKLAFNLTKHVDVPGHRLLSNEEKEQVIQRYNANRNMFKKISINDPVNRYYDGQPGDIYQIDGQGYLPTYRIVINRPLPKKK